MNSGRAPDVLVVGAGVSGLTTGICLVEAGLPVTIRTRRMPQDTTSAVAGAIWGPHLVESGERVTRWSTVTLDVLTGLARDPATGVHIASGTEASCAGTPAPPDWAGPLAGFRRCDAADLPDGHTGGWRYSAPLVSMPAYLRYLLGRFQRGGGRVEAGTVTSLAADAAAAGARAVVNCTGTGARDLVPDPALTPVRGQIVVLANPGLREFFIRPAGGGASLAYLFPHGDTLIAGGTEIAGDWGTEPDPGTADRILRDCTAIEPRLAGARVLAHRVGLRPVRPRVRLEAEESGAGPLVVHNYGHGGAGITLSWGCARDVAERVRRAFPPAGRAGRAAPSSVCPGPALPEPAGD